MKCKNRHSLWFKTIAIATLCLFLVNNVIFADIRHNTLSPKLLFSDTKNSAEVQAALICELIEKRAREWQKKTVEQIYTEDMLFWKKSTEPLFEGFNPTLSLDKTEIRINIPHSNISIRYYDSGLQKNKTLIPYTDWQKTETKVINDHINKQIIYTAEVLPITEAAAGTGVITTKEAYKDSIFIGKIRFPSPFKNPEVNSKLSTLLSHWFDILGLKPESLTLDFPKEEELLKKLQKDIISLERDDLSSTKARNIANRVLILEIYKSLLDIYGETGKIPVVSSKFMGLIYSPGVGWCSEYLHSHLEEFRSFVNSNRYRYIFRNGQLQDVEGMPGGKRKPKMYVVTDCSATLGIGNIAEAGVPVMVGKTVLLEVFGGESVEAHICYVDTQEAWKDKDYDAIIETVVSACKAIKSEDPDAVFMLEDIAAPVCYEIERRLNEDEGVLTIHDDQWGTAIIFAAGVINALELAKKNPADSKIVISGAGASAVAVARVLRELGVGEIIAFDRKGAIYAGRHETLTYEKEELAKMNKNNFHGTMEEALENADGFIGLSSPGLYLGREAMLSVMAENAFVFPGANPDPEFDLDRIKELIDSGELPNISFFGGGAFGRPGTTLNNSFAFPGLYRALTDAVAAEKLRLTAEINITELVLACAKTLASLHSQADLDRGSVMPLTFTDGGYTFKITQAIAISAWQIFTGQTEDKAEVKYANLADELRQEQERTISSLKRLPLKLKEFMQALVKLIEGGSDKKAVKDILEAVFLDSPYAEFIKENSNLISTLLASSKNDVLLRVPVEKIDATIQSSGIDIEHIRNFLNAFQKAPNGHVELYYASGVRELGKKEKEILRQKYGLEEDKNPLPDDFKSAKENTISLFALLKGQVDFSNPIQAKKDIDSLLTKNLGYLDSDNTQIVPIGLQNDPTGLLRGTIMGLQLIAIARNKKGNKGKVDTGFIEQYIKPVFEQYTALYRALGIEEFNFTISDMINLATGSPNNRIQALKKLIKLLPITPIDLEELRQIFEHAAKKFA